LFKWKAWRTGGGERPQIELPAPTFAKINAGARERAMTRTACRCPDWKRGHLHIRPCPLA
jgi:hypothetical protein